MEFVVDEMELGVSPNNLVFLSYYHPVDALCPSVTPLEIE
jgi:hypothetical protein